MAIEVRFNCDYDAEDYLTVSSSDEKILISGVHLGNRLLYALDVSTAIKLSKTIRTEINKVKKI